MKEKLLSKAFKYKGTASASGVLHSQFVENKDQQGKCHHVPILVCLSLLRPPKMRLATARVCVRLDCGIKQLFCLMLKCVKYINA